MLSKIASIPELEIEEKEAKRLNDAIQHVNDVFGIPKLGEKAAAIVDMGTALGAVYGTRLVAITARKRKEAADEKTRQGVVIEGQVIPKAAAAAGSQ